MIFLINLCSRQKNWRLHFYILALTFICSPDICSAHQAPYTNILLDVNTKRVAMELQIPVPELALSFGHDILKDPAVIVKQYGAQLEEYLKAHIHAYINKGAPWGVMVLAMEMDKGTQVLSGPPFWELRVHLDLVPNQNEDTRRFFLDYDVVMHEVINHTALISIRNDWENGIITDNPTEAGVIRWDMQTNTIKPFEINLKRGSSWKGFESMFLLGAEHIRNGTDHLLFLITLLLPACLLVSNRRWAVYGGLKYSIFRLLKIVTAFTVGHSITLLIGVLGFVKISVQLIEVTIAFSILVSAIHAIRPLFYGKEIFIALGFGFIHGLAFSQTLQNLHLVSTDLALSVLGFNVGIEVLQIVVILVTIPWFILMSLTKYFKLIRGILAVMVSLAACGWIVQRITGNDNLLSAATDKLLLFSPWLILGLCILSLTLFTLARTQKKQNLKQSTMS
jgi:hypothetical protein